MRVFIKGANYSKPLESTRWFSTGNLNSPQGETLRCHFVAEIIRSQRLMMTQLKFWKCIVLFDDLWTTNGITPR